MDPATSMLSDETRSVATPFSTILVGKPVRSNEYAYEPCASTELVRNRWSEYPNCRESDSVPTCNVSPSGRARAFIRCNVVAVYAGLVCVLPIWRLVYASYCSETLPVGNVTDASRPSASYV